jgi:hypothetical protein
MILTKDEFIEKAKKREINYEKYIGLTALEVDELTETENFIKKEVKKHMEPLKKDKSQRDC